MPKADEPGKSSGSESARRGLRYPAVAVVLLALVAAGGLAIARGGAERGGGSGDEDAQTADPVSRDQLLRWLPEDSPMVYVVDYVEFAGTPGFDLDDPEKLAASAYIKTSAAKLNVAPFGGLTSTRLRTFVSSFVLSFYVIDTPVDEARSVVRGAGWQRSPDGVYRPGEDVGLQEASAFASVRVDDAGQGRTLLTAGLSSVDEIPDVLGGGPPPEGSTAAQWMRELGGPVGVALRPDGGLSCIVVAATLSSPTEATALVGPPEGDEPGDVTAEDIERLRGVMAAENLSSSGDLVRADLELREASVPLDLLRRLGLPGSTIC